METLKEIAGPEDSSSSAKTRVLGNVELVDKIFSFLDLPSLLKAEQVCQFWSSVAESSFNRRLYCRDQHSRYISTGKFTIDIRHRERKGSRLFNHKLPIAPIPSNLHVKRRPVTIVIGSPSSTKFRSSTALKTLLAAEWSARIKYLSLVDGTLSVAEWNQVGPYLLSCFKSLRNLQLHTTPKYSSKNNVAAVEWKIPAVGSSETCVLEEIEVDYKLVMYIQDGNSLKARTDFLNLKFLSMCPKLRELDLHFGVHEDQPGSINLYYSKVDKTGSESGETTTECDVHYCLRDLMEEETDELENHLRVLDVKPTDIIQFYPGYAVREHPKPNGLLQYTIYLELAM